jgi:uncharacterized membrane protein HdeD (DUF308 family)
MRIVLNVLGCLLIVMGGIWILQGINILPGSYMTGQIVWAYRGGALVLVGVIALIINFRRRSKLR